MRLQTLLAAALSVCSVQALAIPESHAIHERRESAPRQWAKRNKIPSADILPMRIGLTQSNLDRGHDFLMDVSHPHSPNYGKHWSSADVIEMFKPSEETVSAVKAWLMSSGISELRIFTSDNKGWLAFDATTEEAEKLLHTEFYVYEHVETGKLEPACDKYHVPKHMQEHIDYITPGIKLLSPQKTGGSKRDITRRGTAKSYIKLNPNPLELETASTVSNDLSNCDQLITPPCIAALYQIPKATKADPRNAIGVFEEGDFYDQQDLNLFFANYTPYIPQGTGPILQAADGAMAPANVSHAGGESCLDFELLYPIIYPQKAKLFQSNDINYATGIIPYTGGFNQWLDSIDGSYCTYCAYGQCGDDQNDPSYPDNAPNGYKGKLQCGVYEPTNVFSVSYGGAEYDVPAYYQKRQCNEFLKLGLQGISVIFSSGDSGVANRANDDSPNGCLGGSANVNGTIFSPSWPANCPWITSVGATKVYPGKTVYDPESAVVDPAGHPYRDDYSSGGGFSNIYPAPLYQYWALNEYFEDHNPPYKYYYGNSSFGANGGVYNRLGRGMPDVAANGDNIAVYVGGRKTRSGGTSASAPIFASIINLINEERLAAQKGPIGFLNPVLYTFPAVLNDITNGTNPGCGTVGFSAVKGWDPVTGLGTPNYPKMLELFMNLP